MIRVHELSNCFVIANETFLCTLDGNLLLLSDVELSELAVIVKVKHKIKNHQGAEFLAVSVVYQDLQGFQWLSLRSLLMHLSETDFQIAGRALQILRWDTDHQFCGRCGNPTVQHTRDLAKTCVHCYIDFYPRLSPCIIVLITRGDECLLAWHSRSKDEKYSCLAGFIEVGESPEQTLEREVMEEVGLAVENIRYVASQPWPFPGQLMLGFFADYKAGTLLLDQDEIKAAHWYHYTQLPNVPSITTISGRLIHAFVEERKLLNEPAT